MINSSHKLRKFFFHKKIFSLIKFSLDLHLQSTVTYSCSAAAKSFAENSRPLKFDAHGIDFDESAEREGKREKRKEKETIFQCDIRY